MPHKFKAYIAGFGSGKTWVGCGGICKGIWEHPGINQGYFAPTYPQIRDIFYPTVEEVAADWGLNVKINEGNKEVHFYYGRQYRGTTICRSMEKPQTIVGFKIGNALVDELDILPKEKARTAWRKIIARMRYKIDGLRNGIDVTTTPEGFKFVYEQFVKAVREKTELASLYGLVAGTNEFIGEGDAYIPPHTGLPANSTDIAPPDIPAGFVAVFNSDEASWHLVEDHRGKTVYDVASGDALFISELGPLPENVTWLSPEGEFQKWNGTAWVKDTEAEKLFRIREAEETKNNLMQVASEHIAPLQDAADLEIATEEEISLLEAWKKYRVLLNRVDTSTSQDIEWPALP
ncbi:TPA: tail fiber assembly protein [Escherichia coli]|nr:tail fiber assembly protein [Escherichia coli]